MSLLKVDMPPSLVPTLTEVVEVAGVAAEAVGAATPAAGLAGTATPVSTPSAPPVAAVVLPIDADRMSHQVMADIQRQLDVMLEVRLKETLAPIMTRLSDALARDARSELTKVMKEVVSRCVADEIRRNQTKR